VLSGAALGSGTTPNSELRREISASVEGETTFSLDSAYVTRTSADTETLYWFIAVTNKGSGLECFVKAFGLEFKDSAGQTLTTNDLTYVRGSVGASQAVYTDTCLGGGETGHFFGIEVEGDASALYASVDSIVISTLESDDDFDVPAARIIPQNYSVSDEAFSVTVANEGTGAARISTLSSYFLLDENNLPLAWGAFSSDSGTPDNPVLDVGDIYVLTDFSPRYDGLANKVQAQADFDSPTGSLSTGTPGFSTKVVNDEAAKRYMEQRSQLERSKHEAVEKLERSR